MGIERLLHLCGARFENINQISMSAFEVFEHFAELLRGACGFEPKHPVDDMIGPPLIGWIEVAGLRRGFEGPDDDPGRVWPQIKNLSIQEFGLGQGGYLRVIEVDWR
jgi:hypothetical protein